jgi:hypothetical protein
VLTPATTGSKASTSTRTGSKVREAVPHTQLPAADTLVRSTETQR